MRVVILAGGLGTRLAEETHDRPKPMIEVGDRPLLWHIMKGFDVAGLQHFVVALGYRADVIKRWCADLHMLDTNVRVSSASAAVEVIGATKSPWTIDLVETGTGTDKGGRLGRLREWLPDDRFIVTYGDGLSDVDVTRLLAFHESHGLAATVTAVRPASRFGHLTLEGDAVRSFAEKPAEHDNWVNGGFMVFERRVLDMIAGDDTDLERDVLAALATEGELAAYRHDGFWHCVDTANEVADLRRMWDGGDAPWRTWS